MEVTRTLAFVASAQDAAANGKFDATAVDRGIYKVFRQFPSTKKSTFKSPKEPRLYI
jgi:hypothetical protein